MRPAAPATHDAVPPKRRFLHRAAALLIGNALACGGLQAATPGSPHCERQLLEELGWRFQPTRDTAFAIDAGTPCDRASLAEAHAAGDLVVRVPINADPAQRAALQRAVRAHPATLCAYGFALGAATRRAVDRLVANPGFRFSSLQTGWIAFGPDGAAREGWRPIAAFGRGYQPRDSNARALDGFHRGRVRAECGVGRQVAQYAAQAELYGRAGFDAEFAADELVIGTFNVLNRSRSILQGTSAGPYTRDGLARHAAAQGRQAFMGVPGAIHHVFGRRTLDDLHNQAENFVVYDVDAAAARALRAHGGFARYNARNREIWELARTLPMPLLGRRHFQRLLLERDAGLRARLDAGQRATVARIDALLADPFYRGFHVYVHRQGVQPVGYHIVRLLDRNPRTPFRIELVLHNVHTTLYQRYLAHRLQACRQAPVPPA